MQMMVPVAGHPFHGLSLNCQYPTIGQSVFQPLWSGETSMAKLSVVGQCDAQTACDEIADRKQADHRPGKCEWRC